MKRLMIFLLASLVIIANEIDEEIRIKEEETSVEEENKREHFVEYLNYSYPTDKKNLFGMELVPKRSYKTYTLDYTFAHGYIFLNDNWDFNYRGIKTFDYIDDNVANKRNDGWDIYIDFKRYYNDIWFRKYDIKRTGAIVGRYFTEGEHDSVNIDGETKLSGYKETYSIYEPNIGKGGTYASLIAEAGYALNSIENGPYANLELVTGTTWGYGFKTSATVSEKYKDYSRHNKDFIFNFVAIGTWTYEILDNFAFMAESSFEYEKSSKNTNGEEVKYYLGPALLYHKRIGDNWNFYSKLSSDLVAHESYGGVKPELQPNYELLLGISYRW